MKKYRVTMALFGGEDVQVFEDRRAALNWIGVIFANGGRATVDTIEAPSSAEHWMREGMRGTAPIPGLTTRR